MCEVFTCYHQEQLLMQMSAAVSNGEPPFRQNMLGFSHVSHRTLQVATNRNSDPGIKLQESGLV